MGVWGRMWKQALKEASRAQKPARPRQSKVFPSTGQSSRLPDPNLCVYIIGFEDPAIRPIKIGVTNNLQKRLATLQTGCPWRLEVKAATYRPDAFGMEHWLHEHFSDYRIRADGEWFMPPEGVDVVEWVSEG